MGHPSSVDHPDALRSPAAENDPGRKKLKRKEYEEELRKLQTELCSLQDWVKATGERTSSSSKAATPPARGEPSGL